jgi:hypothetical protein
MAHNLLQANYRTRRTAKKVKNELEACGQMMLVAVITAYTRAGHEQSNRHTQSHLSVHAVCLVYNVLPDAGQVLVGGLGFFCSLFGPLLCGV